jgi:hypothetical protein
MFKNLIYLIVLFFVVIFSSCSNICSDSAAGRDISSGVLITFDIDNASIINRGDTVALVKYNDEEWEMDDKLFYEKDTLFYNDEGAVIIRRVVITGIDYGAGI